VTAILLVAVSVGLDNFAAAAAYGMTGAGTARRLELVLIFGLFAGGMPVLGLLLGARISGVLGAAAGPAAGSLLCLTGCYGLVSAIRDWRGSAGDTTRGDTTAGDGAAGPAAPGRDADRPRPASRPGETIRLWLAGAVLSLDSLVVGLALGTYHAAVPVALVVFAAVGIILPLAGLEVGRRAGAVLGGLGSVLGSVALVGVGLAIGFGVL
jgi:putative Mn2+ efflux pump MntP